MTDCMFCHNAILNGQQLAENGEHNACVIECDRRYAIKMCIKCNYNKRQPWWNVCTDCESNNNSDFRGYEGPK